MTLNHNCGCFSTVAGIAGNGIKLKADRLYKWFGDGGLILGCVMLVRWLVCEAVKYFKLNFKRWKQ